MTETPPFVTETLSAQCPKLPENFGVGSSVVVIEPSYRTSERGRVRTGTVTAKARVWVTVQLDSPYSRELRFRLDTQDEGDRMYSQRNAQFRTPEQHTWEETVSAAHSYLSVQGIRLDYGSLWKNRVVKLARVLWLEDNKEVPSDDA